VLNNFQTPFKNIIISFAPNLDSPKIRSTKTIGASTIFNFFYSARIIISI